jgi:hypothetical protein
MPDLRDHLVQALEADLVGPFDLDPTSTEVLSIAPLRWYTAGFLAPVEAPGVDPSTEDDDAGAGDDEDDAETGGQEAQPKAPRRLPSSLGISFLVPAGSASDAVEIMLSFGEYTLARGKRDGEAQTDGPLPPGTDQTWTRRSVGPLRKDLTLDRRTLEAGVEIAPGIWIEGHLGEARAPGLEPGTRAVTVFAVNRRPVTETTLLDAACIFQVALELRFPGGLVPRPNRRDEGSPEWDEKVADLEFRDRMEWAVGHGVSAAPISADGRVIGARSTWLPRAVVPRVETREVPGVTTAMAALASLADGAAARAALAPLVEAYGAWIAEQRLIPLDTQERRDTRDVLLHRAGMARARIAAGIDLLAEGGQVLTAFRLANRAMGKAALQRDPKRYEAAEPAWRLFQLAFVVMNLASIADPTSDSRETVDLIFFPTGGGKTEAYLGLIAFTLALRRLRGAGRVDEGLGVAILLRYTLRLLTLDQLGRAATLICALEEIRRERPRELGSERFSIGLWVGRSATANTMAQVMDALTLYRSKRGPSPFPLPACPWCKRDLEPGCFHAKGQETVIVSCPNYDCPFSEGNHPEGIPVLFVDESIYRELPCFVVATVDKFAMLPWRGETAKLFGGATARVGRSFFGATDGPKPPKGSTALPEGLSPPELIVQDELHLISGPLGTMVGLYETAIEELCTWTRGGVRIVPKIVASTATVRRAAEQVRSLFGREEMMFPPPGVNDADTFFAREDTKSPGRLYVGVAAPGRAMKALLLRAYVAMLGAAEKLYDPGGPEDQTADAYTTLVGYFNSLRELGGMRRLVEDEVRTRCQEDPRKRTPPGFAGDHPWVRRRAIKYEPVELTSRKPTADIALAKSQLGLPYRHADHIDVLLASNMISVGVDIDRLGLMVVAGQPKTTSEYIQASSRVGRARDRPGLVVTVFNVYKARDRSHYERFSAYHESFYRFVEATSVTPFSAPALDRGLAGVLVAMTRLGTPSMTAVAAVRTIAAMQATALAAVDRVADKASRERNRDEEGTRLVRDEVTRLGTNLVRAWAEVVEKEGIQRYSRFEAGDGIALLFTALDEAAPQPGTAWAKFRAPTSMRDVEPSVHIWKSRQTLARVGGDVDGE